jgi:predicted DNA-binding protein (MmcQ/YjbR family)
MNIEEFREYCMSKKGVTEGFPFGGDTLVFKVLNKMFAVTGVDNPEFSVNLKCTPAYAEELREQYSSIRPGYHMNKTHWNTVYIHEGELSSKFIQELTDLSYDLVISKMSKKERQAFQEL